MGQPGKTHCSISVEWAKSCRITWVSSVGARQPQELHGLTKEPEEYLNSGGLWISTNKDTFKLIDACGLQWHTPHRIEVAFQKGAWWFVGVWLDGLLCSPRTWNTPQAGFEIFDCQPPRVCSCSA